MGLNLGVECLGKSLQLVRHGMTEANERSLYCGITDLPLSERGAAELQRIKYETAFMPAEQYITSSLKRTVQTLEILFDKEPDVILSDINEMNFGVFEMKNYEELKDKPEYIRWITDIEHIHCPGGESLKTFRERVGRGFVALLGLKADSLAVVTHGGVIAAVMESLFPKQRNFYEWQPGCGKGYILEFDKNKVSWRNL